MNESLRRYKNLYYFKNYPTYDDYLDEQLSIHVQNEDLEILKRMSDSNSLSSDYIILQMAKCSVSSLPFYSRYLFYEFKSEGVEVLVSRFEGEEDEDMKLQIYNTIRPLINHMNLEEVLVTVDRGLLSILVGEYGRKQNLSFELLGDTNLDFKFLGYFCVEEMGEIPDIEYYVKKDINVIKIVTTFSREHLNLKDTLKNDLYLQFYLNNCDINEDLLKSMHYVYNPYTLHLLFDKLRDDVQFCVSRLDEMESKELVSIYLLFLGDNDWWRRYGNEELLVHLNLEVKDLKGILDLIKTQKEMDEGFFYFQAVRDLFKYIPEEKQACLKSIDNLLFEKFIVKEIKKHLENDEVVDIKEWITTKEAYFSLVVEKCHFLREFHNSFLCNTKKRSQMAEEILKGENREVFLMYLDRRGIYVGFEGIKEVVYDFSPRWMKIFVEENHKKLKQIEVCEPTGIYFEGNEITISMNQQKIEDVIRLFGDNKRVTNRLVELTTKKPEITIEPSKKASHKWDLNPKKQKRECLDEKYLEDLYEGKVGFRKFERCGVLNRFISTHLHDIEGCARVTASVIQNTRQLDDFIRTLPFVIEDKEVINKFIMKFLVFSTFTIPLNSVSKWIGGAGGIILGGKVSLSDLDTLIDKYYTEDLKTGLVLRGYSYILRDHPTIEAPRKIKDGEIVFHYSTNNRLVIKYKDETITYTCNDREGYLALMKSFLNSKCPYRKAIVKRSLKILGKEYEEESQKAKIAPIKEDRIYSKEQDAQCILSEFIKDPHTNLHLLAKSVNEGYELNRPVIFELFKLLKDLRGDPEEIVFQVVRSYPLDKEMTLHILNHFEYYSSSSKIRVISLLKTSLDLKLFVKYCEIVGNEDNLEILKLLLESLRSRNIYFPIVEKWKTSHKLSKLLLRIYPLRLEDKEFYYNLFENSKEEEEKEMLREVYGL